MPRGASGPPPACDQHAFHMLTGASCGGGEEGRLQSSRNLRPTSLDVRIRLLCVSGLGQPLMGLTASIPGELYVRTCCFRTWNVVGHAHLQECTCTSAALPHGRHGRFRRRRRSLEVSATGRRDWPITRGRREGLKKGRRR